MIKNPTASSSYIANVLTSEGLTKAVNKLVKNLKPVQSEFDAIAFRGLSGALVAPNVAQRLRKDLIAVRKQVEKSHSQHKIEGVLCDKYIIIDDFIDGGETVDTIYNDVSAWSGAKLVGLALYNTSVVNFAAKNFLKKHKGVWIVHNGTETPKKVSQ